MARHHLGRGRGSRRPARAVPPVAAPGPLQGRRGQADRRRLRLRVLLLAGRSRGPPPRRRPRPQARLRQLRPRTLRGAARRVQGRGPPARAARPDARRGRHLHRHGPRRDHLQGRQHPGLRHCPRRRLPALHPGQPRGRRPHGHHPRAPRRGPALLHAPPGGADPGADRHRRRQLHAGLRPPAVRHGRGQQEALQARPRSPTCSCSGTAASSPRAC